MGPRRLLLLWRERTEENIVDRKDWKVIVEKKDWGKF